MTKLILLVEDNSADAAGTLGDFWRQTNEPAPNGEVQ